MARWSERGQASSTRAAEGGGGAAKPISTYPPVDPGIVAQPVDEILAGNSELLRRIKLAYGSDLAGFEKDILSLIRRYANYVHLLPATPDNYFNGAGGLLRMGLETAFFALQATDGQIFSGRTTIAKRHSLEPRWRLATFVGGLCNEIHRTLSHVIVADEKGNEWPAYLMPLSEWLAANRLPRYYLRWVPNAPEARSLGVFALPHILAPEVLQHLSAQNAVVIPHLMASVTGMPVYREHNVLAELVKRAAALVIDRDLRTRADRYGAPQIGSHLERYLVDAMRRLVAGNSAWAVNEPKSRVWYDQVGMYVVWPNAAADIRKLLEGDCLPGIPKSPETVLEILLEAGVFEPRDQSSATWTIFPGAADASVEAVKLSSPMIVLAALESVPPALQRDLRVAEKTPPSGADRTQGSGAAETSRPAPSRQPEARRVSLEAADDPQLQLSINEAPAVENTPPERAVATEGGDRQEPTMTEDAAGDGSETPMLQFKFNAPMRFNPTMRPGLKAIIDSMNNNLEPKACTTSSGLFVPLASIEEQKLDVALAIRALDDCGMLVGVKGNGHTGKTTVRDFGGEQVCGVVVNPAFISGLDPADFQTDGSP